MNTFMIKKYKLTKTETAVLPYLVEGLTTPQIAKKMFVNTCTSHSHVLNIIAKLGVNNRTQAAIKAIREDLI